MNFVHVGTSNYMERNKLKANKVYEGILLKEKSRTTRV